MVTDAVLDWFFGLFEWMVQGIPSSDATTSGLNFSFISDLNYFLPISEMFSLFVALFALGGPLVGTSLVIWVVVGLIRGGDSKA